MIGQSSEANDHQLLHRLAGGDMQALSAIYDAYSTVVYHLLLARLADRERAEELLLDVFVALIQRGRGVAQIRDLRAYLLQVARNRAAPSQRRRSLRIPPPLFKPCAKCDKLSRHTGLEVGNGGGRRCDSLA